MQHHLQPVGAVHLRRLVQSRVDRGHGREIDDRAVARVLDNVGDHDDRAEQIGPRQEIDRLAAEKRDDLIDHAAAAAGGRRVFQKHLHQTGKNDPGQEIRQIGRRLHAAFDLFQAQLIEHECEENRERRLEYDVIAVDDQRVFCRAPEIGVGDHLAEMLKTDPRRAPDAEICVIVLKGQLNAVHGAVIEHDHKDKARQDKQI